MSELGDALDTYRLAIRRQESDLESAPQSIDDLTDSISDTVAQRAADESTELRGPEDIRDAFRSQLLDSTSSQVSVTDAVDEEEAFMKGVLGAAGPTAVRLLASAGAGQIVEASKDVGFAIQVKANRIKILVTELSDAFGKFSRGDFSDLAGSIPTTVVAKAQSIRNDSIAVKASVAGLGSVTGARTSLRSLCDAIDDMLNTVMAPNAFTNKIYAIIVELQSELTGLIDLLIELNRDLTGLLAIREELKKSIPPVELILGFLGKIDEILLDFIESGVALATKPFYLRVDVAMQMARELAAAAQVICKADVDVEKVLATAAIGVILTQLEVIYGPVIDALTPFIVQLQGDVDGWLTALRNHVQVDTGVEFTATLAAIVLAADSALSIVALVLAGTSIGAPGTPAAAKSAIDASGTKGFSATQDDFRRGRFTTDRARSIEFSTAAGNLAGCLRDKLRSLDKSGDLSPGIARRTKEVISFLEVQHRSELQSAAVQQTLVEDVITDRKDQLQASKVVFDAVEFLEDL